MKKNPRLLTKSRYKLALECPTKLFYTKKPDIYADNSLDDDFLQALARGGFQVGELAKLYYPGGIDIKTLDYQKSLDETNELLKKDKVIIYEAALQFNSLFIRVDILVKNGNQIDLVEVKSKSINPETFIDDLWNKNSLKRGIHSIKATGGWKPYLYDIAFQTYVAKAAYPEWEISSMLMCADKTKVASVDGLNQMFLLKEEKGRSYSIPREGIDINQLGEKVLSTVDVTEIVQIIAQNKEQSDSVDGLSFEDGIAYYQEMYAQDKKIDPFLGSQCKNCQFRTKHQSLRSGFDECWSDAKALKKEELKEPFVFDLWDNRSSQDHLDKGIIFLKDLDESDLNIRESNDFGLSRTERQWIQVQKEKNAESSFYLDIEGLAHQLDTQLRYPLNFIDFETTMVAIPFHKGRKPYEQIAFQFSHHTLSRNGVLEHSNEFISVEKGVFPNFNFVRALKSALEKNSGSIFRFSHHENTVLNQIHLQLWNSNETDRDELMAFIESITYLNPKKGDEREAWVGPRNMIDLCDWVKKYYYDPKTKGSNSIKAVLPAVLNSSEYLKSNYATPIYGPGVKSKNFRESIAWVEFDEDGTVIDPYTKLPSVHTEYDKNQLDLMLDGDELKNGGAAMIAWAMMQFTEMSPIEFDNLKKALLKYCELDTLAMVMIFEAFREWLAQEQTRLEKAK